MASAAWCRSSGAQKLPGRGGGSKDQLQDEVRGGGGGGAEGQLAVPQAPPRPITRFAGKKGERDIIIIGIVVVVNP